MDTIGYFDPFQPVAELRGGNLPHWRQEGVTYFITFRLADSIPQVKIQLWRAERDDWLARHREPYTDTQRRDYHRLFVERFHRWLDAGHGSCALARPDVRRIVADALAHFAGERYHLREWVIMPNHVHAVVTPINGWELSKILHSWKSYTSNQINKLLGRTGEGWQKESFDHIIRHADQLERIELYIHHNTDPLPETAYTRGCLHPR